MSPPASSAKLLLCSAVLFASLTAYGELQERIITRPYARVGAPQGHPGHAFVHSLLLFVANRLAEVAIAAATAAALRDCSVLFPVAPVRGYGAVSLFNVVATSCQYKALRWIPFPTLSVGKCTRVVAVMAVLRVRAGGQL